MVNFWSLESFRRDLLLLLDHGWRLLLESWGCVVEQRYVKLGRCHHERILRRGISGDRASLYGHSVFIDNLSLHFFISFFTLAFLFLSKLGVFLQKLVALLIPCSFLLLILCFKLFSFFIDSLFFEIFFLLLSFEFIFFFQFLFFHLLLQMLLQQFLFLLFFVKLLIWV